MLKLEKYNRAVKLPILLPHRRLIHLLFKNNIEELCSKQIIKPCGATVKNVLSQYQFKI